MKGQYVIINLSSMDFFREEGEEISYYNTESEASCVCAVYELEGFWILKLIYNHE